MASSLWSVGAVAGSPEYQSQTLRRMFSVALGVAPPGRMWGAKSGVRGGVDSSIITLTSTTWAVAPHPGVIDEADATDGGAYEYTDFDNGSGDLTAADPSNKRVDRLDMQFVQGDGVTTTDKIQVFYTEGVAGANAVAPTAPDNSFPLIEIQVPKAGTGSPTFTWTAPTFGLGAPMVSVTVSAAQSIPNALQDFVFMQTVEIDTHGAWSGDHKTFTAPIDGVYRYAYVLSYTGAETGGFLHLRLLKNSAVWDEQTGPHTQNIYSVSGLIQLSKGDTVQPATYQSTGAAVTIPGPETQSFARPSTLSLEWVGPLP